MNGDPRLEVDDIVGFIRPVITECVADLTIGAAGAGDKEPYLIEAFYLARCPTVFSFEADIPSAVFVHEIAVATVDLSAVQEVIDLVGEYILHPLIIGTSKAVAIRH